jgi:hypothetical protein
LISSVDCSFFGCSSLFPVCHKCREQFPELQEPPRDCTFFSPRSSVRGAKKNDWVIFFHNNNGYLLIIVVPFKLVSMDCTQQAQWLCHCVRYFLWGIAWNLASVFCHCLET